MVKGTKDDPWQLKTPPGTSDITLWRDLGNADEQKEAKPDTIEAWARSSDNPKGGWYGLKKGLRGRFANYVTPVAEALGLVELEHNPKNNRARAK